MAEARRWALIVGASRGIGQSCAVRLARDGFSLLLMSRDLAALGRVQKECEEANASSSVHCIVADVTDAQKHEASFREALQHTGGVLHVLVYNAGVFTASHAAFAHLDYRKTFSLNFEACVRSCSFALPYLMESGRRDREASNGRSASIVLLSSVAARESFPLPTHGLYAASKAAMNTYGEVLLNEVRHHNVKVSTICPGLVATDMAGDVLRSFDTRTKSTRRTKLSDEEQRKKLAQTAKMMERVNRVIEQSLKPSDVAEAVSYAVRAAPTVVPGEIVLEQCQVFNDIQDKFVEKPASFPQCRSAVSDPARKVCFLTGASKGIGRALALRLAKLGFDLGLVARSPDQLAQLADECEREYGVQAAIFPIDVSNTDDLEYAIHATVLRFGNLSAVIHNVGINRRKSTLLANRDIWDQVVDVNFRSVLHATRCALPYIAQSDTPNGGACIFISSELICNREVESGVAPYFATKWGLYGFDSVVFEDVRYLDMKVSTVAPGLTNTALGVKKGPIDLPSGADIIQVEDVCDAVEYVLGTRKGICPRRVLLYPQAHSVPGVAELSEKLLRKEREKRERQGVAFGVAGVRSRL